MLSADLIATRPDFDISAVACRSDHTRWSSPEVRGRYRVVLVRHGRFRRRVAGAAVDLDASVACALIAAAREAIVDEHPASATLLSLAELLGASPYRLSRAFPRELGVSVTHYRHRVRIGRALDRLEAGETSLSTLAADLGYADQAHLTRTLRRYLGHTPTTLRRLLAPANARQMR